MLPKIFAFRHRKKIFKVDYLYVFNIQDHEFRFHSKKQLFVEDQEIEPRTFGNSSPLEMQDMILKYYDAIAAIDYQLYNNFNLERA